MKQTGHYSGLVRFWMKLWTAHRLAVAIGAGVMLLAALGAEPLLVPAVADSSADAVLARVNGVPITGSMLQSLVHDYEGKQKRRANDKEKRQLLQNLITRHLILQQESVQELKKNEEVIKKLKNYEQDLMVRLFLEDRIGGRTQVSDEEIQTYYKDNRHRFSSPPKVIARHILLRSREEAENVLSKLQAGGDFAELAKQYSIDLPMALEGGPMGTIEKGRSLPELEKELFMLGDGQTSGIVETPYGHHILKVDKILPAQFKTLDQVREQIKQVLFRQKEAAAYEAMAKKLEEGADIEICDEQLRVVHREQSEEGARPDKPN